MHSHTWKEFLFIGIFLWLDVMTNCPLRSSSPRKGWEEWLKRSIESCYFLQLVGQLRHTSSNGNLSLLMSFLKFQKMMHLVFQSWTYIRKLKISSDYRDSYVYKYASYVSHIYITYGDQAVVEMSSVFIPIKGCWSNYSPFLLWYFVF